MSQPKLSKTLTFSAEGQIAIPQEIREQFHIQNGTKAQVEATQDGILIKPMTSVGLRSLRGFLKGSRAMEVFREERERERCEMRAADR